MIKIIYESNNKKRKKLHFFNANEKNKNQYNVNSIINVLLKEHFTREDCVVAVGGGITELGSRRVGLDITGEIGRVTVVTS